jgi:hypothetical protein
MGWIGDACKSLILGRLGGCWEQVLGIELILNGLRVPGLRLKSGAGSPHSKMTVANANWMAGGRNFLRETCYHKGNALSRVS